MARRGAFYGQARRRILRENRRVAEHVTETDERDLGVRPGVAKVFRFVDEGGVEREHNVTDCMTFGCPICLRACGGM